MTDNSVIVIGGGIAGLTASALLANAGVRVSLLESHHQVGGCAGTFRRGPYIFDVGATQVAGFEQGGIHQRIFAHLNTSIPSSELLDPACIVDLRDGSEPINLWHDATRWNKELKKHFPGSERFWSICSNIHKANWTFASKDPVLPIRNWWDLNQFLNALHPLNYLTGFFTSLSIQDLLKISGCNDDKRLKRFLDLQLKLYSQEPSERTAALYGATVLQIAQSPLGLCHLHGSMQELSDRLRDCFLRDGGQLFLRHRVVSLFPSQSSKTWIVNLINPKKELVKLETCDVLFTLPPQSLLSLIPKEVRMPNQYKKRLHTLPKSSGALVFYGVVDRSELPVNCPGHIQFGTQDPGSLFVSISRDGDGRAPLGRAVLIASIFTNTTDWIALSEIDYQIKKEKLLGKIIQQLNTCLNIAPDKWLHKELATPRSFAKWTRRPDGIVGGLGQHPSIFGPFGLPSRSAMKGLWLCGDSIYPGEGTAGVSNSALMATRQLMANRGQKFELRA